MSNPETEIGLFENETEVGLFENGKLRLKRKLVYSKMKRKLVHSKMESCVATEKKKLPDGQQQQAISIYFFLEGLGFRV